jgi:hypothetical protein
VEGENPLWAMLDPSWAAGQVARVARFPHAGDLILLGKWDGKEVVSFEDQLASHGGLGGEQDWPFIAFSPEERLVPRQIKNSEEIYTQMVKRYGTWA